MNSQQVVVDVGTGSGILAIAASKLGAKSVYAVDLDAMAVIRAKENIEMNHCQNILVEKNNLIEIVLVGKRNFEIDRYELYKLISNEEKEMIEKAVEIGMEALGI